MPEAQTVLHYANELVMHRIHRCGCLYCYYSCTSTNEGDGERELCTLIHSDKNAGACIDCCTMSNNDMSKCDMYF